MNFSDTTEENVMQCCLNTIIDGTSHYLGTSVSQVGTCLWSVVVGCLEPAVSLSFRTEDRFWCYLNATVKSSLDAAITNVHNGD
ncbi:Uncharacterized protein BM_BM1164 [Brugia malayi]|uniref:Bm1164, isoform a n=1 Tax=Brugia malayi TaxID=6279 RepID=A0A0K0ISC4_BRUMA|nr:Uncharacterized protein BM_BM1164 [Brugia malayi]CDP91987.1 Bm1164, isoform a [Brugia malayi]VIP00128.1 Uncharacterized protein BM_BM1164 [Brugia malayi]